MDRAHDSSYFIEERADRSYAFFIDGDLQFDTRDEQIYHESLALPALSLAKPHGPMSVLICGGGDGLALRECLRFPGVGHVDLVDYSERVIELARTRFAGLNNYALEDARAQVTTGDAWDFLNAQRAYDVILCDFTVPRQEGDTRVFSREWYQLLAEALAPEGIACINAVSPQTTPEAFWCLRNTIRAAGLNVAPFRVCIPSFRAQGYGVWAFMLASRQPLNAARLRGLPCPVAASAIDVSRLYRGASFSRAERQFGKAAPIHSLSESCLLPFLLNPGCGFDTRRAQEGRTPSSEFLLNSGFGAATDPGIADYSLEPLFRAIPITHPYHTRAMIETLARQVAGTVRGLDLKRLLDALLARAAKLPPALVGELTSLKRYIAERVGWLQSVGAWGARLFAALIILLTLANAIAPDNAFAKGGEGLGHASFSRGFSGSFSGERGFTTTGRGASSFSGEPGFGGGSRSTATPMTGSFVPGRSTIASTGFRGAYSRGETADIYGNTYRSRSFTYCGGGSGHVHTYYSTSGGTHSGASPQTHRSLFAADDDLLVLDNGDVVITLSDAAYLLVTNGTVALFSNTSPDPVAPVYPDPPLFQAIENDIRGQLIAVQSEINARRDWLSWVGWTSAVSSEIAGDRLEMRNLQDLQRRLQLATSRIGTPTITATPDRIGEESTELFVGGFIRKDGRVAICDPSGRYLVTDGRQIWPPDGGSPRPCPQVLRTVLLSVMKKLSGELTADAASQRDDMAQIQGEYVSLNSDLMQYRQLFVSNGFDPNYEVDYGSDEIGVQDAINRTENDITQNRQDLETTSQQMAKSNADIERIRAAMASMQP